MSKLIFSEQAWDDFTYWQDQDKKTLKRIFKLITKKQSLVSACEARLYFYFIFPARAC